MPKVVEQTAPIVLDLATLMRPVLMHIKANRIGSGIALRREVALDTPWIPVMISRADGSEGWYAVQFALRTHDGTADIRFEVGDERKVQRIKLTTTQGAMGRCWWFICPQSGRRVQWLCLPLGADRFLSPPAHGLEGAHQHQFPRNVHIARLLSRLGVSSITGDRTIPAKPRGMKSVEYGAIVRKLTVLLDQGQAGAMADLDQA